MQPSLRIKFLLVSGLAFFLLACNNSNKKETAGKEKPADTAVVNTPPATEPPGVQMERPVKKCFSNMGLQYRAVITMKLIGDQVLGMVTTEDLESHKKETVDFEGSISKNQLSIKFNGAAPAVGRASEWTTKSWFLDTTGKEKLRIIFNAKNPETNKWAETEYVFELSGCR